MFNLTQKTWGKPLTGILILGFFLAPFQTALAATSLFPKQLNYQAKLTDASGVAVADGNYNITFRLYTTASSATTTNIWEETHTGANRVPLTSGLLSTMMGQVTSLASVNFNQTLYLGVEVGGTTLTPTWDGEMSPRKQLGAVPAALVADTLDGLDSSAFVQTNGTSTVASSSAQTLLTLNQSGAGNILDLIGTTGTNFFSVLSSGNVGIGTTSPYAKLSVAGQVVASFFTATSTATSTFAGGVNVLALNQTGSASSTFANGINLAAGCFAVGGTCVGGSGAVGAGTTGQLPYYAANGTTLSATSSLFIKTDGFVGVNNTNPLAQLDIISNASSFTDAFKVTKNGYTFNLGGSGALGLFPRYTSPAGVSTNIDYTVFSSGANGGSNGGGSFFKINPGFVDDTSYVLNVQENSVSYLAVQGNGNVGVGTSSPYAKLSVAGQVVGEYFTATSTTATSTFANHISIGAGKEYRIGGVGVLTKDPTSGSIILGNLSGNARGGGFAGLDLQSTRSAVTQVASGIEGVALGVYNTASGDESTALGHYNTASSFFGTAVGYSNTASNGVSVGRYNTASGDAAIAFGASNSATNTYAVAIGRANSVGGDTSLALGHGNNAWATGAYAIGIAITNTTPNSVMIGPTDAAKATIFNSGIFQASSLNIASTTATSTFANHISIGADKEYRIGGAGVLTRVNGSSAVLLGDVSGNTRGARALDLQSARSAVTQVSSGDDSVAVGLYNQNAGSFSAALGAGNITTFSYQGQSAVGYGNLTSGNFASAFGASNIANTSGGFYGNSAVGYQNLASAGSASAFGASSTASGLRSSAFGYNNIASGQFSSVLGASSTVSGYQSSAFGFNNIVSSDGSSVFGSNLTNTTASSTDIGPTNGSKATIFNSGIFQASALNISTTTATSTFAAGLSLGGGGLYVTNGGVRIASTASCGKLYTDVNGVVLCGVDAGAGGTSEINWTYFNGSGVRVSTSTNQVLIGGTSTTSSAQLELTGNAYFSGNLGLGTTSPYAKLSVVGQVVGEYFTATSTTATSTFTAGVNVGNGNGYFIAGTQVLTNGAAGLLVGPSNTGGNANAVALGRLNTASANLSSAVGASNSASGLWSSAFGYQNTVSGSQSSAFGYQNTVTGNTSSAIGRNNSASGGNDSSAFGQGNISSASPSSAFGYLNLASGIKSSAFGASTTASALFSSSFGYNNISSAQGATAIGSNITNNIASSTMIGPSDTAKLTILSSGNVGIGTTSPYAKLSVVGDVVADSFNATSSVGYQLGGTTLLTASSTLFNTFVGLGAGTSTTSGNLNTFVGYQSGQANTTGFDNTAIGYQTLFSNTTGSANAASGRYSLFANTTGSANTANGVFTLSSNTTGAQNTATGYDSLYSNTIGFNNTANGYTSMPFNTTGSFNTANGAYVLWSNTGGSYNTANGAYSLYSNTIGASSTAMGYQSGRSNTTGNFNTFLGFSAGYTDGTIATGATLTNATAIGYNAQVQQSNSFILGGTGAYGVNVGIGTTSPYAKLSVVGEIVGAYFTGTTTATSTFGGNIAINGTGTTTSNGGFNISSGCFAVNGTCVSGGSGTAAGGTGAVQFANGTAFAGDATNFSWDTVNRNLNIGGSLSVAHSGALSYSVFGTPIVSTGAAANGTDTFVVGTTTSGINAMRAMAVTAKYQGSNSAATVQGINAFAILDVAATAGLTTNTAGGGLRNRYLTTNNGTGLTVAQQSSISAIASVTGTGSITTSAADFHAETPGVNSGNTLTNFYSLWARGGAVSGTLTNRYGVYVDDLVGGTNRYGIYQAGSSDNNYFAGNVGIGTTSPYAKLSVVGQVLADSFNATSSAGYQIGGMTAFTASSTLQSVFVGIGAGTSTTASFNTALGHWALQANTTGDVNTAVGHQALMLNNSGYNTAVGGGAMKFNTTGSYNTAVGSNSLGNNTTADQNAAFGDYTLRNNTIGSNNTALGQAALSGNLSGSYNTAVGQGSFINNTTGASSTAIGYHSGAANITGSLNTFVGFNAGSTDGAIATLSNLTNATAIGYNAQVTANNSLILGGTGAYGVNVGIGTTSPYAKLSVVGEVVGAYFTGTTTATSTFGGNLAINGTGTTTSTGGFNISAGCFAVNGTCVGNVTGGSSSGVTGTVQFSNGAGTFGGDASNFFWDNTTKNLGIGTSSPYAKLSVAGQVVGAYFTGTSTATSTFGGDVNIGATQQFAIGGTGIVTRQSNGALLFGNLTGNTRGAGALDLQAAHGVTEVASGGESAAVGLYNKATGFQASNAFGYYNYSLFDYNNAFGDSNVANGGNNTSAFGSANIASGSRAASAFGSKNLASGAYSSAFGASTTASALFASSFGYNNISSAQGATAIGSNIINSIASSTQIGPSDAAKVTIFNSGIFQASSLNVASTTATSTFANGIQLSAGCFRDSYGNCVGKGRAGTFTVAAYNSINKQYADYVADYTHDEVEINAAITAAYSASRGRGGKVYLLEGDFRVGTSTVSNDSILMQPSTALVGAGDGTTITLASSTPGSVQIVSVYLAPNVLISHMTINGNKANQAGGFYNTSIQLGGSASSTVQNVRVENSNDTGLSLSTSDHSKILNNTFSNNAITQINISTNDTLVEGNTISGDVSASGIQINPYTGNIVTNNHIISNWHGVALNGSPNVIVSNNVFETNTGGDAVWANSANNGVITGNYFHGNSTNGGNIIQMSSSNDNLVSENVFEDNGGTTAVSHIFLTASSRNVISSNKISDTAGTGYAINISDAASVDNSLANNYYSGKGANRINDVGVNTKYTQWDRVAMDTKQLGQVAYSPFSLFASSSVALASTTQMGSGKIMSLNNSTSEVFTVANNGWVGIGVPTPANGFEVDKVTQYLHSGASPYLYADGGGNVAIGGASAAGSKLGVNGSAAIGSGYFTQAAPASSLIVEGSIGIGTTSPYAKLSVAGNAVITGLSSASSFNATSSVGYQLGGATLLTASSTALNVFLGFGIGGSITNAVNNTFIGNQAGALNTSGSQNTFVGDRAGYSNATGTWNSFFGQSAGFANTIGESNSFFGRNAGERNITGSANSFFGRYAGGLNTAGSFNTANGAYALYNNTTGASSTAMGYQAGYNNTTGNFNTFLGFNAGYTDGTTATLGNLTNATAIGYNAQVTQSNSLILGGTGAYGVNVGIGTTSPWAKLALQGVYGSQQSLFEIASSTNASGSATSSLFTVLANGNVGIGVTNPSALLHVNGAALFGATGAGQGAASLSTYTNTISIRGAANSAAIASGIQFGDNFSGSSRQWGIYNGRTNSGSAIGSLSFSVSSTAMTDALSGATVMTLDSSGNIGIGTTTPTSLLSVSGTTTIGSLSTGTQAGLQIGYGGLCVDNDGTCVASTTGRISAVSYTTGSTDLAENYFSTTHLAPGDIVMMDATSTSAYITLGDNHNTNRILGIVSTKPAIILGLENDMPLPNQYPIALAGRVPVSVNLEHGPIKQGDRITISSQPGVGAKAVATSSLTVGIALEDWSGVSNVMDTMATGTVLAFVNLQHSDLSAQISGSQFNLTGTSSELIPLFGLDAETNDVRYLASRPFNFAGQSLLNVKSIVSSSGKWSLSEEGRLVVEEVNAKRINVEEQVCIKDVCVNRDQLNALLLNAGLGGSGVSNTTPVVTTTSTSSTTPTTEDVPPSASTTPVTTNILPVVMTTATDTPASTL